MAMVEPKLGTVRAEAWRIHAERGHPEGYEGPCWGPTEQDIEEARRKLTATEESA